MTSATTAVKTTKREEPEWVVIVVVAVALLIGWLLKMSVEGRTVTVTEASLSIAYPDTWLREFGAAEEGLVLKASDLSSGSLYRTQLEVRVTESPLAPAAAKDPLTPAVTTWTFGRGQELSNYRVLDTAAVEVAGLPATRIDYTFVSDPIASPYRHALPVVVEAIDYLFLYQDQVYVITLAADGNRFDQESGQFEAILDSVALE